MAAIDGFRLRRLTVVHFSLLFGFSFGTLSRLLVMAVIGVEGVVGGVAIGVCRPSSDKVVLREVSAGLALAVRFPTRTAAAALIVGVAFLRVGRVVCCGGAVAAADCVVLDVLEVLCKTSWLIASDWVFIRAFWSQINVSNALTLVVSDATVPTNPCTTLSRALYAIFPRVLI